VEVPIETRISLKTLSQKSGDKAFYSILAQGGYLSLVNKPKTNETAVVSIPNHELTAVWKNFIIDDLYAGKIHVRTLFDNVDDLQVFSEDLEYFLTDRLSYHDLAGYGEFRHRAHERAYHLYLLGILSAYEDIRCRYPLSNRESGDGRYDIMVEKPDMNIIFELKTCDANDDLEKKAQEALSQIDARRYGADINVKKQVVNVGVAFYGKLCKVKCGVNTPTK
jgi:hypothetical protein